MAFPHENPIISPLHPSSANASASSFHLWSLCPFTCDHRTRQRLDACKYMRFRFEANSWLLRAAVKPVAQPTTTLLSGRVSIPQCTTRYSLVS